jgi:hypothetical protein
MKVRKKVCPSAIHLPLTASTKLKLGCPPLRYSLNIQVNFDYPHPAPEEAVVVVAVAKVHLPP